MRINCIAGITNRLTSTSASSSSQPKPSRASVALGIQKLGQEDKLAIHICTTNNKQGSKYPVVGNIEAVFSKFIQEGKFTIRLKDPTVDLFVKADPIQAKAFLKALKLGLQTKDVSKSDFRFLAPVKQKQIAKPQTILKVVKRNQYPVTAAFARTLEIIHINDIELNRIENRIINLPKLKCLDMGNNIIKSLPLNLNTMQALTELKLSKNKLEYLDPRLFTGSLQKNLHLLDVSHNQLKLLPHTIGNLHNLVTLDVSNNNLIRLPMSIGRLRLMLRFLNFENNKLTEIPSSMKYLYMGEMKAGGNNFIEDNFGEIIENRLSASTHSLVDLAASTCTRFRLKPTAADIPANLVHYLDRWLWCVCGKICYKSYIITRLRLDCRRITNSITMDGNLEYVLPATSVLCSYKCYDKYKKTKNIN